MILYSLEIFATGFSEKEALCLCEMFRYHATKNRCSWFLTFSNTQSRGAKLTAERLGKVGRPQKIVIGKKVAPHVHVGVTGNLAHKTVSDIQFALEKKGTPSRIVSKGDLDGSHGQNYIKYCFKQSTFYRQGGENRFFPPQ